LATRVNRVLRDGEGSFTVAGPLSRGEVAEVRSFLVFKGSEGLFFPGRKSKSRPFQKAGRVGHPKNLNQILRVHALQRKGWPPAGIRAGLQA
jgi:hypothetical protein